MLRMVLVAAFAGLAASACAPRSRPAAMVCASTGDAPTYRLLVVGDSWAARGRLDRPLAQAMSLASGRVSMACSLGYPGRTSAQIAELAPPAPRGFDQIVLLVGVNDQVYHVGRRAYHDGVEALAEDFAPRVRN